jgi:hypothetical protein
LGGKGAGGSVGGAAGGGVGGAAGGGVGGAAGGSVGGAAGGSVGGAAGGSVGGVAGGSVGGAAGGSAGGAAGGNAGGAAGGSVGGAAGGAAGGSAGGAGGGGGASLLACNNVVNGGQVINKDHDAGAAPAMTGGTIAAGTYYLTKMVQYNGENGNTAHQETWVVTSNTIQIVGMDGSRINGTYVTSANQLTLTITCPAASAGQVVFPFTATSTQVTTLQPNDANEAHTYTLSTAVGACTNLVPTGAAIPEEMATGSAPAAGGGTVPLGTYELTGWKVYAPATADPTNTRKLAMRIGATSSEVAGIDPNNSAVNLTTSYTASGTTISSTFTCGATGSAAQSYSMNGNDLWIYNPRSGGVEIEIWTLQP